MIITVKSKDEQTTDFYVINVTREETSLIWIWLLAMLVLIIIKAVTLWFLIVIRPNRGKSNVIIIEKHRRR